VSQGHGVSGHGVSGRAGSGCASPQLASPGEGAQTDRRPDADDLVEVSVALMSAVRERERITPRVGGILPRDPHVNRQVSVTVTEVPAADRPQTSGNPA
jgi:hypothetical protein